MIHTSQWYQVLPVYIMRRPSFKKIETLLSSNYPKDKLTIYIGSDASSDESNAVIAELAKDNPQIKFFLIQKDEASLL